MTPLKSSGGFILTTGNAAGRLTGRMRVLSPTIPPRAHPLRYGETVAGGPDLNSVPSACA